MWTKNMIQLKVWIVSLADTLALPGAALQTQFSLNWPHLANSVIDSPCPSVVLKPVNLETQKLGNLETWKLGNLDTRNTVSVTVTVTVTVTVNVTFTVTTVAAYLKLLHILINNKIKG